MFKDSLKNLIIELTTIFIPVVFADSWPYDSTNVLDSINKPKINVKPLISKMMSIH
jgi:hypothetical protein